MQGWIKEDLDVQMAHAGPLSFRCLTSAVEPVSGWGIQNQHRRSYSGSLAGALWQYLLSLAPASATYILGEQPKTKVQPSLQRDVTPSPVSQQYPTLLAQRQDTRHLCCHCATLLCLPSCSSGAAAFVVQQEGFPTAAAEFCFSDQQADVLLLPPRVPPPRALQHTRRTVPVTNRKISGVKYPDRTSAI